METSFHQDSELIGLLRLSHLTQNEHVKTVLMHIHFALLSVSEVRQQDSESADS